MSSFESTLPQGLSMDLRELIAAVGGDETLAGCLERVLRQVLDSERSRLGNWALESGDPEFARWAASRLGYLDVARVFDDREIVRFLDLLPQLHETAGSPHAVADTLRGFLAVPLVCRATRPKIHRILGQETSLLGERFSSVGRGWFLGSEVRERLTSVELVLGPLGDAELQRLCRTGWLVQSAGHWEPGGKLELLQDCLMPLHVEPCWVIRLERPPMGWRLGVPGQSELAATTRLSESHAALRYADRR